MCLPQCHQESDQKRCNLMHANSGWKRQKRPGAGGAAPRRASLATASQSRQSRQMCRHGVPHPACLLQGPLLLESARTGHNLWPRRCHMKEGATEVLACKHTYRGSRCIPRHPWVSFAGPAPDTCAMLRGCRGAVGPNKRAAPRGTGGIECISKHPPARRRRRHPSSAQPVPPPTLEHHDFWAYT